MSFDSTSIYGLRVNFLFKEYPLSNFGKGIERRLRSTPDLVEGFISDVSGNYDLLDLYDSSSQNSIMVDKLVDYRLGNTVSLDDIVYDDLEYTLAKLIYIYLDLMVNANYLVLDTIETLSGTRSAIDNLFEIYVLNEAHRLIKTWTDQTTNDTKALVPVRRKYVMDTSSISVGTISITSKLPSIEDGLFLYKNGVFQETTKYSYSSDSTSFTLNIDSTGDNTGLNLSDGDIIVFDAYTVVNPVAPTVV